MLARHLSGSVFNPRMIASENRRQPALTAERSNGLGTIATAAAASDFTPDAVRRLPVAMGPTQFESIRSAPWISQLELALQQENDYAALLLRGDRFGARRGAVAAAMTWATDRALSRCPLRR